MNLDALIVPRYCKAKIQQCTCYKACENKVNLHHMFGLASVFFILTRKLWTGVRQFKADDSQPVDPGFGPQSKSYFSCNLMLDLISNSKRRLTMSWIDAPSDMSHLKCTANNLTNKLTQLQCCWDQ